MHDPIMTHEEWVRNPGWTCSYDDYVRHVKAVKRIIDREREDRLIKRIVDELENRKRQRRRV